MWDSFVPIEYEGMSIITALILFGVVLWVTYIWSKLNCLSQCMTDIKVTLGVLEAYSKEHKEDIREIKKKMP